jgi:GntR family transcriptional regulator / MocR family aminotransferase
MVISTGPNSRSTFDALNETSQAIELLLSVSRDGGGTLGVQIEQQLRRAIHDRSLRPGARLPSTRDLAGQLGVSRRIVVDAYAQLAAEGFLLLRQGARPTVSPAAAAAADAVVPRQPAARPRYDFRPSLPDVSTFPRAAWLRSMRQALGSITDADLGYGDPCGVNSLRLELSRYLGRVRGVVSEPQAVVVTSGYWQGLGLVCRALAMAGATRIGVEDPSHPDQRLIAARSGLTPVPIEVDASGMRIDQLEATAAEAVILTPAHQDPTGAVLSGERRMQLLAWLRDRDAIAIEDDYDAEYRYDRAAVRAIQGLEPGRVVYAGSASKTLAPALRLGWLVVPARLLDAVAREKLLADQGSARIEQCAFADFLQRGELDRHLRRMRIRYRSRRDALVEALAEALPEARVEGISAGLHASVRLPDGDEDTIVEHARGRRIELSAIGRYRTDPGGAAPTLLLGYAQLPEPSIRAGVPELAAAVRSARAAAGG